MDVREKLVELLREVQYLGGMEEMIADHLIAHGVTVQELISVKDRLPEEWTNVLVYSGGNYDVLMYRPNRRSTLCFMYQDECGHWTEKHSPPVTHWMPLPEPPKGE
jgi:hypothetical protein